MTAMTCEHLGPEYECMAPSLLDWMNCKKGICCYYCELLPKCDDLACWRALHRQLEEQPRLFYLEESEGI